MKNNTNDRRNFLKTAGAALVAASVLAAIAAQTDEMSDHAGNRREELYLSAYGWNRNLPGVYGKACFKLEMRAELGAGGFGTISDAVYAEINSHFEIHTAQRSGNVHYFNGRLLTSHDLQTVGKTVAIRSEVLDDQGNSRVWLTIESTPLAMGLLLPAVQQIKIPIYS